MPDMLVKLYDLPPLAPVMTRMEEQGIDVRPALAGETKPVLDFVGKHFSEGWVSEATNALAQNPITCHIAVKDNKILGFSCWDATKKAFFGPTGVDETHRGKAIGKALLLDALYAMKYNGYGYCIIGWVGPAEFYTKCCGAVLIPDSEPGVYKNLVKE